MKIERYTEVADAVCPFSTEFGIAESVSPSHSDRLSDRVADTVLDAILQIDGNARCGIEVMLNTNVGLITGEVTASGLNASSVNDVCAAATWPLLQSEGWGDVDVRFAIRSQAPELTAASARGAGDQSVCIGAATDKTDRLISLEQIVAREVTNRLWTASRNGLNIGRDGKVIVVRRKARMEAWLRWQFGSAFANSEALVLNALSGIDLQAINVNVGAPFPHGSLAVDTGALGRKLICDSYGCNIPNGGGAISGKDATKVDRIGNYGARWAACELVRRNGGDVMVWLVYTLGEPRPVVAEFVSSVDGRRLSGTLAPEVFAVQSLRERFGLDRTPDGYYAAIALQGHYGQNRPWD